MPFKLAQDSTVTAKIYDVTGKQIRMIELDHLSAGNYVESSKAIYWDGRTEDGEQVSSGTYFYQIEAGDYTETRKMLIVGSSHPQTPLHGHPQAISGLTGSINRV